MKVKPISIVIVFVSLMLIIAFNIKTPMFGKSTTEILWDTWGVPHIYAQNKVDLFKAFGWAQTKSHGNLLLKLYGQSRGKAAQYWGNEYVNSDRYVVTMDIPNRAKEWYQQQSLEIQSYLDAFATGINDYITKHPSEIEPELKAVLPITGTDILAHIQRVMYFHFLFTPQQVNSLQTQVNPGASNAWAIAPSHSTSGNAMLLANPHLPWSDLYLWYEAQLNAPDIEGYGATLVGMPVLAIAFNNNISWTLTFNYINNVDIYQLNLKDNGYMFDGVVKPFTEEKQVLKIKQANNTFKEETIVIKNSIHGAVIAKDKNSAYAVRIAGLDQPNIIAQFLEMIAANNLSQFETALAKLQLPLFNILYADKQGQIFYVLNGQIPKRNQGDWDYWQEIIPGDTSETLWTEYHEYKELPHLINPDSGWLQNTNDPPWTSTFPSQLKAEDYPSYFAPPSLGETNNIFRPQRSIKLLTESDKISFEEMIEKKFSSRLEMADRLLEYLIPAARYLANPIGVEAGEVLAKWDRQANEESRGAALFTLWALALESSNNLFAKPWQETDPLNTPTGLADHNIALGVLEGVAAQIKLLYGNLEIPWGDIVRMRYGDKDLPASGGLGKLGSFRVLDPVATKDEKFKVVFGDTYIAAVEFTNPIQAQVLMVYGNATQQSSSHVGDQLPLYARNELRKAWLSRSDVENNLELQEGL